MPQARYPARCYEVRNSLPANKGLEPKGLSPFELDVVALNHICELNTGRF